MHEIDDETWNEQLAVNLTGHFLILRAALPHLLRSEGDRSIVNVGSTLAHKMVPGHGAYVAAKGGIVALTKQLAVEYGPDGIRANCVMPAVVRTPLAHTDARTSRSARHVMAQAYPMQAPRRGRGRRRRDRLAGVGARRLDHRHDHRRRRRLQRHLTATPRRPSASSVSR